MDTRPSGALLLDALESGDVRVAEPVSASRADKGHSWRVNTWVKEAILELFRSSASVAMGPGSASALWPFVDKETLPMRRFDPSAGVRVVPGGTSVRRGAYLGPGVVLMPPAYVNVGAYVGARSMIDSHALVGSCAQIGAGVHLSAGAQIGGVLEPVGSRPVIIEDDCLIGGQSGIYEGVLVGAGAVLAAGVLLTASTRVYDLVHEVELEGSREEPLAIPPRAVLVPGARPARGDWAAERGLDLACALIVKYRDASTDAAVALEEALRP